MSVKPIPFKGPLIRALLEGRKTQTRRVIKGVQSNNCMIIRPRTKTRAGLETHVLDAVEHGLLPFAVGDLLWVRETWQAGAAANGPHLSYRATPDYVAIDAWDGPDEGIGPSFNYDRCPGASFSIWLSDVIANDGPWRPSIFMPRWASRLTLEVINVRVLRLQDITEEDARAEGLETLTKDGKLWKWGLADRDGIPGNDDDGWHWADWRLEARDAFHSLWNSLNEKRGFGWATNPWVVAVTFKVHQINVDALLARRIENDARSYA